VLNEGLLNGAHEVGKGFEAGVLFLPELMLAGRALKMAMAVLTPAIRAGYQGASADTPQAGRVVLATVQTDIHDIGKNTVSSMLTATGLEVIDLGVDVPVKNIITTARDANAQLIAVSALLTTSLPYLRDLLELLKDMGLRQRFRVMVGGAAVTQAFVEKIGADGTAPNAVQAAELARQLLR
jgi:methylmalonyl-CoA mutase cobalamin-binding domain/chain